MGITINTNTQRDERAGRRRGVPMSGPITYTKYGQVVGPLPGAGGSLEPSTVLASSPAPTELDAADDDAAAWAEDVADTAAALDAALGGNTDGADDEDAGPDEFEAFNPETAELDSILGGTVGEVRAALERIAFDDVEAAAALLERLANAEAAGKCRAGVLGSIERRAAALAAHVEAVGAAAPAPAPGEADS